MRAGAPVLATSGIAVWIDRRNGLTKTTVGSQAGIANAKRWDCTSPSAVIGGSGTRRDSCCALFADCAWRIKSRQTGMLHRGAEDHGQGIPTSHVVLNGTVGHNGGVQSNHPDGNLHRESFQLAVPAAAAIPMARSTRLTLHPSLISTGKLAWRTRW
jgi:hypothetical protein